MTSRHQRYMKHSRVAVSAALPEMAGEIKIAGQLARIREQLNVIAADMKKLGGEAARKSSAVGKMASDLGTIANYISA